VGAEGRRGREKKTCNTAHTKHAQSAQRKRRYTSVLKKVGSQGGGGTGGGYTKPTTKISRRRDTYAQAEAKSERTHSKLQHLCFCQLISLLSFFFLSLLFACVCLHDCPLMYPTRSCTHTHTLSIYICSSSENTRAVHQQTTTQRASQPPLHKSRNITRKGCGYRLPVGLGLCSRRTIDALSNTGHTTNAENTAAAAATHPSNKHTHAEQLLRK
jgi:hypothetical protein